MFIYEDIFVYLHFNTEISKTKNMKSQNASNFLGKNAMAFASLVLVIMYLSMHMNQQQDFDEVKERIANEQCVLLNKDTDPKVLAKVLTNNHIATDGEATFIAHQMDSLFDENQELENLEHLKKNKWKVPQASVEASNSAKHKKMLEGYRKDLEQTSETAVKDKEVTASEVAIPGNGTKQITVMVKNGSANDKEKDKPCAGVLVHLKQHYRPSAANLDTLQTSESFKIQDSIVTYAKTDANGVVVFKNLQDSCFYSVLPIKSGFKYGNAQRTVTGKTSFTFNQIPMGVTLFNSQELANIKENNILIVRIPDEYTSTVAWWFFIILLSWWGLWLASKLIFRRPVDNVLIASLMVLTEMGVLSLFAFNSPLNGALDGRESAIGVMIGIGCMLLMQMVDFVRFYQGNSHVGGFNIPFDPMGKVHKIFEGKKGFIYLFLAIMLSLLLFVPGLGKEIGGMTVNLKLGGLVFQPSEIAKYLIVIFMAAYFCQNADTITRYSEQGNTGWQMLGKKFRSLLPVIIGMVALLGLYVILQDMGPAMVVLFTFIILYSIIKSRVELKGMSSKERVKAIFTCDLAMLLLGTTSFGLFVWLGSLIQIAGLGAIIWFVGWIGWGLIGRKQVFESPIMFNIVLSVFIFAGNLSSLPSPLGDIGDRLNERTEMCTNTWGDLGINDSGIDAKPSVNGQIAHGLWALSTGGFTGQGLGKGSSGFVPAYHTDMILESMGEQVGFLGLFIIMVVYIAMLRSAILTGYQSKHPFAMFLCTGIAIATAVQLFIIALGSTGVIPLTGITVPLLSYGKVSIILNLVGFGIVLSISSHNRADNSGSTAGTIKYRYTLGLLNATFFALMLLVLGTLFKYTVLDRDHTLIRPLYVKTTDQGNLLSYNPRINQIVSRLPMGNIYDRNGVVLATSNPDALKDKKSTQAFAQCNLKVSPNQGQGRRYPFGDHTLFMVGDFNTHVVFGSNNYLSAESRYLEKLRGYDNRLIENGQAKKVKLPDAIVKDKYTGLEVPLNETENEKEKDHYVALRDYSKLLPYLKAGFKSDRVKEFIAGNDDSSNAIKPENIQLTIDAVLQTRIQQRLEEHVKAHLKQHPLVRVSAVVVDADNGDLLTSSNYPLPNYNDITKARATEGYKGYNDREDKRPKDFKPYTDEDLGITFATPPGSSAKVISAMSGIMLQGETAAHKTYNVYADQRVGTEPALAPMSMEDAIVRSSNCYFINMVNDFNTFSCLDSIYSKVGVFISGHNPYVFDYTDQPADGWRSLLLQSINSGNGSLATYRNYIDKYNSHKLKGDQTRMRWHPAWQMTWGQGEMSATPLVMARVAATVVNEGRMPVTRYLMTDTVKRINIIGANASALRLLKGYMVKGANDPSHGNIGDTHVGGKTGTAERPISAVKGRRTKKMNDGWFMCYYQGDNHRYGIAVRVERIPGGNYAASVAAPIVRGVILTTLAELNYLN